MGYEDATSTKMLASHCAICGRPLRDALSVEAGIGPDCRDKWGYYIDCMPEAREEANRLVHQIAVRQDGPEVGAACGRLQELGFVKLAARVLERVASVRIIEEGSDLVVESAYSPEAVALLRKVPGRRWDGERKVNVFPAGARLALWAALRAAYPGSIGSGPRGVFFIEAA